MILAGECRRPVRQLAPCLNHGKRAMGRPEDPEGPLEPFPWAPRMGIVEQLESGAGALGGGQAFIWHFPCIGRSAASSSERIP